MEITGANANWCHTVRLFKMLRRHVNKGTMAKKGVGYFRTQTFYIRQPGGAFVLPNRVFKITSVSLDFFVY